MISLDNSFLHRLRFTYEICMANKKTACVTSAEAGKFPYVLGWLSFAALNTVITTLRRVRLPWYVGTCEQLTFIAPADVTSAQ